LSMSVIALHLVFMGYGHWLPNDPRGSGSVEVRNELLDSLGQLHRGRKAVQPSKEELRSFYREAAGRLEHEMVWFDEELRGVVGGGFEEVIGLRRYTCWACAVMRNHAHLCVRRHKDTDRVIWGNLARRSAEVLHACPSVPGEHPIWADRPYAVFLETPEDIRRVVKYIEENPMKEGLGPQRWGFVRGYDGWPLHKGTPRKGKPW
jgi:hypothetical protein